MIPTTRPRRLHTFFAATAAVGLIIGLSACSSGGDGDSAAFCAAVEEANQLDTEDPAAILSSLQSIAAAAPSGEIADAANLMAGFFERFTEIDENADDALEQMGELLAEMESPEMNAAVETLDSYSQEECGTTLE